MKQVMKQLHITAWRKSSYSHLKYREDSFFWRKLSSSFDFRAILQILCSVPCLNVSCSWTSMQCCSVTGINLPWRWAFRGRSQQVTRCHFCRATNKIYTSFLLSHQKANNCLLSHQRSPWSNGKEETRLHRLDKEFVESPEIPKWSCFYAIILLRIFWCHITKPVPGRKSEIQTCAPLH